MKIAVVGGGIGGLALALSLHDAGLDDVTIYEAAPAVQTLGVGINVLPHAVRELAELGLLADLAAVGIPTAELVYYSAHGQRIWGEPRGLAAGYRWPQFSLHRGDLLGVLHRAVLARLGPERLHLGQQLVRLDRDAGGAVRAWFADRASGDQRNIVAADLLVGCDGVHSVVRQALYPDEGPPCWNGITMWRATTVGAPFLSGRTMLMAGRFGHRIVVYPISKRHEDAGQALINWVAELKTADGRPMPRQDWSHTANREEALAAFAAFAFDFLDVPALIRGAEVIYQYPMVDREPLPTWDFGRVTLLGDAAHPMYPVGSNGASQAILDARILARELALRSVIGEAIAAYDAARRPATAAVVYANRQAGPEQCMDVVAARAPDGFTDLDAVISARELAAIASAYKQTAGFDPAALNSRPSFSVRRSGETVAVTDPAEIAIVQDALRDPARPTSLRLSKCWRNSPLAEGGDRRKRPRCFITQ